MTFKFFHVTVYEAPDVKDNKSLLLAALDKEIPLRWFNTPQKAEEGQVLISSANGKFKVEVMTPVRSVTDTDDWEDPLLRLTLTESFVIERHPTPVK